MPNNCPEGYAELAARCERAGDWAEAAKNWKLAAGCSIGNNRATRYDARAENAESKTKNGGAA